MTTIRNVDNRSFARAGRCLAAPGLIGIDACSLQNLDSLSSGSPSSGAGHAGVTGTAPVAGSGGAAGAKNTAGATAAGGSTNTVSTTNVAGAVNTGGSATAGGSGNAAGTTSGGRSSTNPNSSGGVDSLSGCAAPAVVGQLVVPPSTGFEVDLVNWTTTAAHTSALSRVAGNGTNCEGDWYMSCSGSQRQANWDGPMIEVGPYVSIGHTYQYSVAVRQSPATAAVATIPVKLTIARTCSTTVYDDLITLPVSTAWTRLTGQFTLATPGACATLSSVKLFVATNENGTAMASFDVDDLRLVDLSPRTTSGAAGAAGTSGAAVANAGTAGVAGAHHAGAGRAASGSAGSAGSST